MKIKTEHLLIGAAVLAGVYVMTRPKAASVQPAGTGVSVDFEDGEFAGGSLSLGFLDSIFGG